MAHFGNLKFLVHIHFFRYPCLIAKEFKYHQHCYRDFTRHKNDDKKTCSEKEHIYSERGDYIKVKEIIEKNVLTYNEAVLMTVLHEAYGLEVNDN